VATSLKLSFSSTMARHSLKLDQRGPNEKDEKTECARSSSGVTVATGSIEEAPSTPGETATGGEAADAAATGKKRKEKDQYSSIGLQSKELER
jgi:hypothetical protein